MLILGNKKYSVMLKITDDPDVRVYDNINVKPWGSLKLPPRWVDYAEVDVVDDQIEKLLLPEAKVKAKKVLHPENFDKEDGYYIYKKDVEDYTKKHFDCISIFGDVNNLYVKNYMYLYKDVRIRDPSNECIKVLIITSGNIDQKDVSLADIVDTRLNLLVPNKPAILHTTFHGTSFPHVKIPLFEAIDPMIVNGRKEYDVCTTDLDVGMNNERLIKAVFRDYVKIPITNMTETMEELTKCKLYVTAPISIQDFPSFYLRLPISASVPLVSLIQSYVSYEARAYPFEGKKKKYKPQPNMKFSILYTATLNAYVKGELK